MISIFAGITGMICLTPSRNALRIGAVILFAVSTLCRAAAPAQVPNADKCPIAIQDPTTIRGRLYYSLKRPVVFPFRGIIQEIKAQNGQKTKAGDVLLRYQLTVESIAQLSRRVHPDCIGALQLEILEAERNLDLLENQKQEVINLGARNLASPKRLKQIEEDINLVRSRQDFASQRLKREKKLLQDDLNLLKDLTGESITSDNVPATIALTAPIDAVIIQVSSSIRNGAETVLDAPAFMLGVLDPIILRCQVHESDAVHIAVEDPAEFTLESMRDRKFSASVSRISLLPLTDNMEQPSYYEIELTVPNPDGVLKEGYHGQVILKKAAK